MDFKPSIFHAKAVIIMMLLGFCADIAASQVLINEFLTSNVEGIHDEDGDTPDWIELLNTGPGTVDLDGWFISDDLDTPLLWTLPPHQLSPGGRILIFASGKDRDYLPQVWETVITRGDVWHYTPDACSQSVDWIYPGFDDSEWDEGPTGIGFGDGDDETTISYTIAILARSPFQVDDPSAVSSLVLHIDYDDAFVAYVNGVEIARSNIGIRGIRPDCDEPALTNREAQIYDGGLPDVYVVPTPDMLIVGENTLAIEVHNSTSSSSDMSFIPWLSLGLDSAPVGGGDGPAAYIRFMLPHLHTDFGLGAAETISLHDSNEQFVDEINTGASWADISSGRAPDGAAEWRLFTEPTPCAPNADDGCSEFAVAPVFSRNGGLIAAPVTLEIFSPIPTAEIRFTSDGSDPDQLSPIYHATLPIADTRIIRARCFEEGKLPSRIVTASFLFSVDTELPVVSLVTDPANLWDDEIGIYILGPNASTTPPHYGANFWQDWERQAHVEFFDTDGTTPFAHNVGIKIHGGMTRALAQKSLRLIARGGYGASRIEHQIFPGLDIDEFKTLILRNAGNDWCVAHLRDLFMHGICSRPETDIQAGRQAIVYLNGEYWGIHNIRERLDKDYLETHHGINPDEVDILEGENQVVEGDNESYLALLDWIANHSLSEPENYGAIQTMIQTDNFTLYNCFEIYFANTDWPHGNIRYWRPREPGGRWRWMFKDMDISLGIWDEVDHNTLAHALDPDGGTTNPPWSTLLLRSLMDNPLFRRDFINSYAELMSGPLAPTPLTESFAVITGNIEGEIQPHFERWEQDYTDWYGSTDNIRDWIAQRPGYARQHIMEYFDLPATVAVTLAIAPPGAGTLQLTATEIDSLHRIIYFEGNPVPITAAPRPGWSFDHWSDLGLPDTTSILLPPTGIINLTAHFTEAPVDEATVVINEINYNSAATFDPGDWIEFHNPGTLDLDLTGWSFRDSEDTHVFNFPAETLLGAGSYLVLCRDMAAFTALYPDVEPVLDGMDFGFSGAGELLRVYDDEGAPYDVVEYDDSAPWPTEPDGLGATLELIDPESDNSLPTSWAASADHGTPGEQNSCNLTAAPAAVTPSALRLAPPWPNPFNPTTTISFDTPAVGRVRLSIFDPQGRLVDHLIDRQLTAGTHRITWNADGLSSGVYLVRLDLADESRNCKLLLLK
ncbi:MAG: T9SS type A sorting domain-containing protein [bacterium]|nr:T9SS type A sorting domain-containing protein [bacterium]